MKRTPFKELRLEQFRSLSVCARTGNLVKAAQELGISRPALWQQIRSLERRFDADFFVQRRYGVELSDDGRTFLELAEPLLAEFQSLKQVFDDRRGRRAGALRVACPDSIEQAELPPVLDAFRRRCPTVVLQVVGVPSSGVAGLVLSGDVQVGIEADPPAERDTRLTYEPLFRRHIYVVVPRRHALVEKRRLTPADLAAQPFVMEPPFSRLRQHLAAAFTAKGLADKWRIVLETANEAILLESVRRGMAVSVVTGPPAMPDPRGLRLLPADHLFGPFPIFLVRRRRRLDFKSADEFCALLRETLQPG